MKPKKPYKIEDILSGLIPKREEGTASPEQQEMVEQMKGLFGSTGNEKLDTSEKEQLWQRITQHTQPAQPLRQRSLWLKVAAAVTVLLLAGVGVYYLTGDSAGKAMQLAAQQAAASASSSATQLILADQRAIHLSNEESAIAYQDNGAVIRIDSASVINQSVAGSSPSYNTLVVPYGKRSTLTLHDGTKVWLNSGSKLVYPAHFTSDTREVYLDGEAYFSVQHDAAKPFYVHTRDLKIEVLGTEFDVSAYADDKQSYTVLARGSIELTANKEALFGKITRKIVPGTRAVYDPAAVRLHVEEVQVEEYTAWKEGYLVLRSVPLADILKRLARYYRIEVAVRELALGRETFSGRLDLQEDITNVLDIICATTSLTYEQHERRFVLEK